MSYDIDLDKLFKEFFKKDDLKFNSASNASTPHTHLMNPAHVYAPLIMTDDITTKILGITANYTLVTVPLWMGDIHNKCFHDLISGTYRNNLTPSLRKTVQESLVSYSKSHKGNKFIIRITDDVSNGGITLDVPAIFEHLNTSLGQNGIMTSEWTTPIRMQFFVESDKHPFTNRLVYGGHFYATGTAEVDESDVDYTQNANGDAVASGDKITKITLNNIYWEDYRNKKGVMKLL